MYIDILERYIDDHLIKRVGGTYFTINNYEAWEYSAYLIGDFSMRFWVRRNNSNDYALRLSDCSTYYYLKWPNDFHCPKGEKFLLDLLDGCNMDDAIEKLLDIILPNRNFGCKYGLR